MTETIDFSASANATADLLFTCTIQTIKQLSVHYQFLRTYALCTIIFYLSEWSTCHLYDDQLIAAGTYL